MVKQTEPDFLTVPNILSIIRILASPFLFYILIKNTPYFDKVAIILIVFSMLTDILDGYIARHFKQQSKAGKVLDPIADKFMVDGTVIIFCLTRNFPIALAGLIILRDILIVILGSFMMFGKLKMIPQSNITGKTAMVFVGATILTYLVQFPMLEIIQKYLIIGSYLFIIVSGLTYFFRFIKAETKKSSPG